MSKAVLITIRPGWCKKIASGEKSADVRKTCPNIPTPYKCYIYEPKGKRRYCSQPLPIPYYEGTGKIIGEFVCNRVETLVRVGFSGSCEEPTYCVYNPIDMSTKPIDGILDDVCLSLPELEAYLAGAVGYAWHISELKIYDKPKKLTDFIRPENCGYGYDCETCNPVHPCSTRPPQSWRYVEAL